MRKLTEQEINQIFDFTKKHYVEYYDVQVELVDHLANAIEVQWEENPNITFDEALQIEFKKFGIFGFTGLIEKKQSELTTHYNKMFWKSVLQFITIPKVIITIALYLAVFTTLIKWGTLGEIIILVLLVCSYTFTIIDGFRYLYKIKKDQKKQGRNWLIQSVAKNVYAMPAIGLSGSYYTIISRFFEETYNLSNVGLHFLSALFVFQIICTFVLYQVIKPKLETSIQATQHCYQTLA